MKWGFNPPTPRQFQPWKDVPAEGGHGSFAAEELEDAGEVVATAHSVLEFWVA